MRNGFEEYIEKSTQYTLVLGIPQKKVDDSD